MSKILDVSKIGVANKEYSTGIKKFNLASEVDRYFRGTSKRFFPDEDKKVTRDRINKLLNSKSKRKKLLEDHIKEITPSSFASKVKFDDFKLDVGRLLTYYVVIEPNQDEVKSIIELRKNVDIERRRELQELLLQYRFSDGQVNGLEKVKDLASVSIKEMLTLKSTTFRDVFGGYSAAVDFMASCNPISEKEMRQIRLGSSHISNNYIENKEFKEIVGDDFNTTLIKFRDEYNNYFTSWKHFDSFQKFVTDIILTEKSANISPILADKLGSLSAADKIELIKPPSKEKKRTETLKHKIIEAEILSGIGLEEKRVDFGSRKGTFYEYLSEIIPHQRLNSIYDQPEAFIDDFRIYRKENLVEIKNHLSKILPKFTKADKRATFGKDISFFLVTGAKFDYSGDKLSELIDYREKLNFSKRAEFQEVVSNILSDDGRVDNLDDLYKITKMEDKSNILKMKSRRGNETWNYGSMGEISDLFISIKPQCSDEVRSLRLFLNRISTHRQSPGTRMKAEVSVSTIAKESIITYNKLFDDNSSLAAFFDFVEGKLRTEKFSNKSWAEIQSTLNELNNKTHIRRQQGIVELASEYKVSSYVENIAKSLKLDENFGVVSEYIVAKKTQHPGINIIRKLHQTDKKLIKRIQDLINSPEKLLVKGYISSLKPQDYKNQAGYVRDIANLLTTCSQVDEKSMIQMFESHQKFNQNEKDKFSSTINSYLQSGGEVSNVKSLSDLLLEIGIPEIKKKREEGLEALHHYLDTLLLFSPTTDYEVDEIRETFRLLSRTAEEKDIPLSKVINDYHTFQKHTKISINDLCKTASVWFMNDDREYLQTMIIKYNKLPNLSSIITVGQQINGNKGIETILKASDNKNRFWENLERLIERVKYLEKNSELKIDKNNLLNGLVNEEKLDSKEREGRKKLRNNFGSYLTNNLELIALDESWDISENVSKQLDSGLRTLPWIYMSRFYENNHEKFSVLLKNQVSASQFYSGEEIQQLNGTISASVSKLRNKGFHFQNWMEAIYTPLIKTGHISNIKMEYVLNLVNRNYRENAKSSVKAITGFNEDLNKCFKFIDSIKGESTELFAEFYKNQFGNQKNEEIEGDDNINYSADYITNTDRDFWSKYASFFAGTNCITIEEEGKDFLPPMGNRHLYLPRQVSMFPEIKENKEFCRVLSLLQAGAHKYEFFDKEKLGRTTSIFPEEINQHFAYRIWSVVNYARSNTNIKRKFPGVGKIVEEFSKDLQIIEAGQPNDQLTEVEATLDTFAKRLIFGNSQTTLYSGFVDRNIIPLFNKCNVEGQMSNDDAKRIAMEIYDVIDEQFGIPVQRERKKIEDGNGRKEKHEIEREAINFNYSGHKVRFYEDLTQEQMARVVVNNEEPIPNYNMDGIRVRFEQELIRLKRNFELIKPERVSVERRTYEGELDEDAAFDMWMDKHNGENPEPNIFTNRRIQERDLSLLITINTPNILGKWVDDEYRLFDYLIPAVLLTAEAADILQDQYAIMGYSSRGGQEVLVDVVKDFDEDNKVKRDYNLGLLSPLNQSRTGTAYRHFAEVFGTESAKTKIHLDIVGKLASDTDYSGERAINDTIAGARRMRANGIKTFAIVADPNADEATLNKIYGAGHFRIIKDPTKAVNVLLDLYKTVTLV